MIYKNSKIDYDRLVSLLWQKGLTPAKFNSNYRKKTGSNEQILDRLKIGRDIKLSSAVNICNEMDISLDVLLGARAFDPEGGKVVGDGNVTAVNGDVNGDGNVISSSPRTSAQLAAENKALRMVIDELRKQLASYASTIDSLSKMMGRMSDCELDGKQRASEV